MVSVLLDGFGVGELGAVCSEQPTNGLSDVR